MAAPHVIALVVALVGCATDLRTGRIPNALTFSAAAAAIVFHGLDAGLSGVGHSLAGFAVGLAIFLPLFALGGLGGGDVKLLAALGAWMGPGATVWMALWAAIAGGPLALIVALSRGYLRKAFENVWSLLMFWRVVGIRPHPSLNLSTPGAPRLPYALPIAVGLVVTLWTR
jgi:prepilin peptidase CpaA